MDCIICRYGELALKGKNRDLFENKLVSNMKVCLERNSIQAELEKVRGRIFVFTKDSSALVHLRDVFGLVSISPASVCASSPEDIKGKVIDYAASHTGSSTKTFRISTHRVDKAFPKSSHEMDIMLGDAVGDKFNLKAKMKEADIDIGVEIHDRTFIFHEKIDCHGGLPLGMGGNVACLVEKEQDIAAAWLMMRRGCAVFPVLLDEIDVSRLARVSYGEDMISSRIRSIPEANNVISKRRCLALVVGDTFEGFDPERYSLVDSLVLAPLIGYDGKRLSALKERIAS